MIEGIETNFRPTDKVGRTLYKISVSLALFGALMIAIMGIAITTSVIGRATNIGSVTGIYDLIELWTCTAIFAFLPYCQLMNENVIVDFILNKATSRVKSLCDALGSLIYLLIGMLLTWRLVYGGIEMHQNNETFTTLGFPRWISFPYAIACLSLLAIICLYTFWQSVKEVKIASHHKGTEDQPNTQMPGER
jgi:TRAP-type C4-dicarboxylate transport system permease small subunit